jgi:hypothetical protein
MKVVSFQPYAPAAFTPSKYSWYSFLLEAESTPGLQSTAERITGILIKLFSDIIGKGTSELPAFGAVSQPAAPPRAPEDIKTTKFLT